MQTTSPEQIVQAHYDAIARRDRKSIMQTLSDDIDWELLGPSTIPIAGNRRGHEEVEQFFATIRETVEIKEFQIDKTIVQGSTVVVCGSERFLVIATGKEWDVEWVHVHTVENGKVTKFREYTDTAAIQSAYSTQCTPAQLPS